MQGKLVWALAFVSVLVIIGPASSCRLCGCHLCGCHGSGHGGGHGGLHGGGAGYSRPWDGDRLPPLHLTVPVIQPPGLQAGLGLGLGGLGGGLGLGGLGGGLGGLGAGLGGGLGGYGGLGGLGGGNLCSLCGGYNRGYYPRDDYSGSRGYSCRCSPRRNRLRYDDY